MSKPRTTKVNSKTKAKPKAKIKAKSKSSSRKTKPQNKKKKQSQKKRLLKFLLVVTIFFVAYISYLNVQISQHIDGEQWSSPSRVYARPLLLTAGLKLSKKDFLLELDLLSYRRNSTSTPGSYSVKGNRITLHTRHFNYPNQQQHSAIYSIEFNHGFVADVYDSKGYVIKSLSLEPVLFSSFYGDKGEDRLVLDYEDIPKSLIETLIAVEDRQFYEHFGINPLAIARALWVNIQAGRTVQGGSTLTQQLVKNIFLSSKRSLVRKINEAFYAILIELKLDKKAIITAYVNQVFLTQRNKVAVHGFALASQFLFRKPLNQLGLEQQALLVAMIKGPSYYHPSKHPKRALTRRNLIIDIMSDQNIIAPSTALQLKQKGLGLQIQNTRFQRFPAFIDLVKKQLPAHYDKSLLKHNGLRIFTTLDPIIQLKAEHAIQKNSVLKAKKKIQAASVIVQYKTGNILALISDRTPSYPGFNRAILAQRPIGSLIKPFVLYTLLEQGESLSTQVEDRPIRLKQSDGAMWIPQNYDSKLHGTVSLYQSLVNSYNLPFVRIGLEKSLQPLVRLLEQFNLQKNKVIYPSLLLGSIDLTPLEIAQLYQTLANDGVYSPLSSIRFVTNKENQLLSKNPIESVQLLDPSSVTQVQSALAGVTKHGTAKYLNQVFPNTQLAGKTGTTDDYKDSWYAGFSERLLGVTWLGFDDNKATGLTGSAGALRLWSDIFKNLPIKPLQNTNADNIVWVSTDPSGLYLMDKLCEASQLLPFKIGEQPDEEIDCEDNALKKASNWLRRLFQ